MKKSFAKVFLVLGVAGFAGQGMAANDDLLDHNLTNGAGSVQTGAELTIDCVGSLTGIKGRDTDDRSLMSYYAGGTGAGTPGGQYRTSDGFSVDASCPVVLSISCAPGFGDVATADKCDMVRLSAGLPVGTPSASDKIEILDVKFGPESGPLLWSGTPYADLTLNDISGVTNENRTLIFDATLGATSAANKAGTYRVDVDITIAEF